MSEEARQSSVPEWWCSAGTWSHADPPADFDVYVLKTATVQARVNPCPLVLRPLPDGGYLNRIGVRNPGIDAVLANLPAVPGGRLVVSVLGFRSEEWGWLAMAAAGAQTGTLELNLSCPNTEAEPVGSDVEVTHRAVSVARSRFDGRLGAKLPPTASGDVGKACEDAGADYLVLSNTLGTPLGGMSGRPLRALALDCIGRIAPTVGIGIVGGGGILSRDDAQPYLDAGASALFMGTANMLNGSVPEAGARGVTPISPRATSESVTDTAERSA
jgi:dihydroorotate dehydrogenase